MGTNYYYTPKVCPHCGRGDDPIHIGRSSGGWCFSLHVYPEDGIHTLDDWKEKWKVEDSIIQDEYGHKIGIAEMIEVVTQRSA